MIQEISMSCYNKNCTFPSLGEKYWICLKEFNVEILIELFILKVSDTVFLCMYDRHMCAHNPSVLKLLNENLVDISETS